MSWDVLGGCGSLSLTWFSLFIFGCCVSWGMSSQSICIVGEGEDADTGGMEEWCRVAGVVGADVMVARNLSAIIREIGLGGLVARLDGGGSFVTSDDGIDTRPSAAGSVYQVRVFRALAGALALPGGGGDAVLSLSSPGRPKIDPTNVQRAQIRSWLASPEADRASARKFASVLGAAPATLQRWLVEMSSDDVGSGAEGGV